MAGGDRREVAGSGPAAPAIRYMKGRRGGLHGGSATHMNPPLLVELERGDLIESRHRGHVAVTDTGGKLLAGAGDPRYITYMRSAAKPLQALAIVHSGAADELGLTTDELAVACASHNGEDVHVAAVSSMLARAGASEDDLECGWHPPARAEAYRELMERGGSPGPLHHNCSGKHAGMIAVCAVKGWPRTGYSSSDHPLQDYLAEIVSLWSGVPRGDIVMGTDGCGVPVVGIPLQAMATAWARLVRPETVGSEWAEPACRVVSAMRSHPFNVGGTGRICTAINGWRGADLVSKGGAEGVYCIASLKEGWGLAVKIEDGGGRASGMAGLRTALDLLGLSGDEVRELTPYLSVAVTNTRGEVAGRLEPVEPWPVKRYEEGC